MTDDNVLIVQKTVRDGAHHRLQNRYHIVLQDSDPDFNVALCGEEVVVEDPELYIQYLAAPLSRSECCWECFLRLGEIGQREAIDHMMGFKK